MPDLLSVALDAQRAVGILLDERRRVEFALLRYDKAGVRELGKSMIHLYFDLTALHEELGKVVGAEDKYQTPVYDSWFYDYDVVDNEQEAWRKLIAFFRGLSGVVRAVHQLANGLANLGISRPILQHLLSHVGLEENLLWVDIQRVTGAKL